MAMLNFNARAVAPELPRDPIPAGVYLAQIIESDVVKTKAGGEMLKLTHEIIDGPCKGRRVWSNINTKNASPEAERIGQAQLSALCHAVGVLDVNDSSMLHMIPVRVRVSIRPAGPDRMGVMRDAQNEVKGYDAAGNGVPVHQPHPATAAAPSAAARGTTAPAPAPWARRA